MDTHVTRMVSRVADAARREQLKSPEIIQRTKAVRYPAGSVDISTFQVYSAYGSDGYYNCYKMIGPDPWKPDPWGGGTYIVGDVCTHNRIWYTCILAHSNQEPPNATYWSVRPTELIFNLVENDTYESPYKPGLARLDELAAWKVGSSWLGIPITPSVRRFKTTEAAPAQTYISGNVILNDGTEASASADILYDIDIYCNISGGGNLDEATRRLGSGDYLSAHNLGGKWWATEGFMATVQCDCYGA